MYVWLYLFLGCTRACLGRCDGDVICVDHDLTRMMVDGKSEVEMLNSVVKMTPPWGTPVLN